jgi:hypothetical protein
MSSSYSLLVAPQRDHERRPMNPCAQLNTGPLFALPNAPQSCEAQPTSPASGRAARAAVLQPLFAGMMRPTARSPSLQ